MWLVGIPALGIRGIQTTEYLRTIAGVEAVADKERDAFERWFADQRRSLGLFAASEWVAEAVATRRQMHGRKAAFGRERIERQLTRLKEASPGAFNHLYVVAPNGTLLAATDPDWGVPPPDHASYLAEAAQPGLREFVYLLDEIYGPSIVVTNQIVRFDVDGLPTGEIAGILVASLSLRAPLVGDDNAIWQGLGESGAAMLIDRESRILVSDVRSNAGSLGYAGGAVSHGSEGVKILTGSDGQEMVLAFRHLHLGTADGLTLAIVRSTDQALSAVRATFVRLGAVGVAMFLIAMALVLFAARRIADAESKIRELNAGLEARVAERTGELESSNIQLRDTLLKLEGARDDLVRSEKLAALGALVAGVAHEMNTPIGNARLIATTLKADFDQFAAASSKLSRGALEAHLQVEGSGLPMLVTNLERAADLISSFKQLAADQTSEQRRQFSLLSVVHEVATAMGPTLRRTPYVLDTDVPADLTMDSYPGPLSRILVNFINNAVLHGFEGRGSGRMELRAHAVGAEFIELTFSDDGAGMSPETARRVFDPFYTTKLGKGGSGLGMHLAYSMASQVLGGKLSVEHCAGKGDALHPDRTDNSIASGTGDARLTLR